VNQEQIHRYEAVRAAREAREARRQEVVAKSELARVSPLLARPVIGVFLSEYGQLVSAADPVRSPRLDGVSRSADPPSEGDATAWARQGLVGVDRGLVVLTARLQGVLGTPPAERVTVDESGKCVTCGRRKPARVRVSRGGVEE
jgi:hypothetical protein